MRFRVEPIIARPPKRLRATLAACADSKANWLTPADVGTNASLMQRLLQFDCVSLGLQRAVCRNATWEKRKLSPESSPFACAARICREGCPQLAGLYCRRSSWPVCEVSSSRSMSHVNRFTLNWHLPAVRRQKVQYRIVSHSHDRRPGQRSCVHRFPYLLVAFGGGRSD